VKLHELNQQSFVSKLLSQVVAPRRNSRSRSTDEAVGRKTPGSNSSNGDCFLSPSKEVDWLCGPHSLLVHLYWPSAGITRPGREPNNSTVSSAEVKVIGTKVGEG
jgi:hypothetical protein